MSVTILLEKLKNVCSELKVKDAFSSSRNNSVIKLQRKNKPLK